MLETVQLLLIIESGERFIYGGTGSREIAGAFICDVEIVFESDAEFTGNDKHGFVSEAHAWLHWLFVAFDEVDPFVSVQADPVAGPVGASRKLVASGEAVIDVDLAGGRIRIFAGYSDASRGKDGGLGFFGQVPYLPLLLARFAEDDGSADVRPVAVDVAASVHQNDVSFFQFDAFDAAVGIG